jgi:hypothetical protein
MAMAAAGPSACASLPTSSAPVAVGALNHEPDDQTITPPAPGRAPDQLLQDFLNVAGLPGGRHAQARQYLTKDAAASWNDAAGTTIVTNTAVLRESQSDSHAVYLVRATRVGMLRGNGVYQSDPGTLEAPVVLSRFGSEWRIDQLPPGVILDRAIFQQSYHPHPLYFLNPADTALVPDMRWIYDDRNQLAGELVADLAAGPRPGLAAAVRTELGTGVSPNPPDRADGGDGPVGVGLGGVKIDFRGASVLDVRDRMLLAAQLIWTLDGSGLPGPYLLFADGKPLDDRYASGWTVDDVAALRPGVDPAADVGLYALRAGALVRVDNTGLTEVPGYFGSVERLQSASLSRDGRQVAAVAASDGSGPAAQLLLGGYGGGPVLAASAGAITQPTWSQDDRSVWVVLDGTQVLRATRDPATGEVGTTAVDSSALAPIGRQITQLRLSRDGVRAAMIVDGKVAVAAVVVAGGRLALADPTAVPIRGDAVARALAWRDGADLLVSEDGADAPLVTVPVDGSSCDTSTSQNLTPSVVSIDVTPSADYAEDSRAVFELQNTETTDRFWREVPGLIGVGARPVLPG